MIKETVLIVGLGEVGQTLYELFTESGKFDVYGTDIDEAKVLKLPARSKKMPKTIDVMHLCFRCGRQENFAQTSVQYIDEVVDMLEDVHRSRLNKPLHYPAVIGGHCLIPNTELLLSVYDSEFLRLILESNEKRKKEIKNHTVLEEVEKVKKRADALQEELMKKW